MPSEGLPRKLGEFTLGGVLGEGGSAIVYAASSARHPEVALKVLREELALSERERQRFFDEVERMRRVRHPALVPLVDAGVLACGRPYLCMPLLRAETAAARIDRGGRLPVDVALGYFQGLAGGVTALHRAGLVHRDIKPENVLLETGGRAILLDFGIARDIHRSPSTTTQKGALRGTPMYMAPERFFGAPATTATDIYELGVLLYAMLVGALPWDAETPDARLRPILPQERNAELPPALVAVVMRALSTRPEARPESASAFARDALSALHSKDEARPRTRDVGTAAAEGASPPAHEAFKPVQGAVVAARYRLDRLLGKGGMGEVWAATHTVTQKAVALKFLRSEIACDSRCRRRFLREAHAASRVLHPSVIQIHDVIELDFGVPVMVMDLLEGESLGERLARERVLPLAKTARVLLPVVSAVQAAHRRGVVHRDLKPDNIFLASADGEARVVVLDFGIAKVVDPQGARLVETWTKTSVSEATTLGTPFYMSPEQLYGDRDIDHRADLWALGVILYECLAGRRPTQAESLGQVLKIVSQGAIVPVERLVPDLPSGLAGVIMAMLSADREDRPSLAAVRRELDEACRAADASALGAVVAPISRYGVSAGRRSRHALVAGSLGVTGVVAAVIWGVLGHREPRHDPFIPPVVAPPAIAASESLPTATTQPRREQSPWTPAPSASAITAPTNRPSSSSPARSESPRAATHPSSPPPQRARGVLPDDSSLFERQ